MSGHYSGRDQLAAAKFLGKWLLLATPVGMSVGSACALFLWSLEWVTNFRHQQGWLLYCLPVAGVVLAALYGRWGRSVEAGNNLIVDEIHQPGGGVPLRMAPLVLIGTLITHLCGGSAGREGTAVQMGGSLADGFSKLVPSLSRLDRQTLLMAGIAAGFGGVFGTPFAGALFALEVLMIGRVQYAALVPCLIASMVSDRTCVAWGVGHTHYHIASVLPEQSFLHLAPLTWPLVSWVAVAGILFGLTSVLFAELMHGLQALWRRWMPQSLARPAIGGALVILLTYLLGTRDYLGLGVSSSDPTSVTIVSCFRDGGAHDWSWLWKLLFTALTLSCGFKGGEVTPLFFIGAALGNSLAMKWGVPVDLFAALGFASVFAGATNTPVACTIMAIELFGAEYSGHFAISCGLAYLFSGHTGIYQSQRLGPGKGLPIDASPETSLRDLRKARK